MRRKSSLLFLYYIYSLLSSWSFWLLVLFLICSYLSAQYQTAIFPKESIKWHSCLSVLSKVSIGYIAGYTFYLVFAFIPNKKLKFNALQIVSRAEYRVLVASFVLELYRLGEPIVSSQLDYETQKRWFIIQLCEKSPYEQCENEEDIDLMSYWKIHNRLVDLANDFIKHDSIYFDLLLGSHSKYLSYEELESIIKLKQCLSFNFADHKDGNFTAKFYKICQAFDDVYNSKKLIAHQLQKHSFFCVDKDLAHKIDVL